MKIRVTFALLSKLSRLAAALLPAAVLCAQASAEMPKALQERIEVARKSAPAALRSEPSLAATIAWVQAVNEFESNHYGRATDQAIKAIAEGLDSAEVRLLLAKSYTYTGQLLKAEMALLYTLDRYPQTAADVYLLLAKIYLYRGDADLAEAAIGLMSDTEHLNMDLVYDLGEIRLRQGNYRRAAELFSRYIEENPGDAEAHIQYVRALLSEGRYDDAVASLETVLELDPNNKQAHFTLIQLAENAGDPAVLLNRQLALMRVESDDVETMMEQAHIAEGHEWNDTAIDLRARIARVDPKSLENRRRLGRLLAETARTGEAVDVLRELARENPELGEPLLDIGYIWVKEGKYEQAAAYLEQAVRRVEASATRRSGVTKSIYVTLGKIYLNLSHDSRALQSFMNARRSDPKDIDVLYDLAEVYRRLGDVENSARAIDELLQINPEHAAAMNYLGYLYAELGIKLGKAENLVRRALELDPGNGYYMDSLGWVFFKRKKYDDAVEYLKKAADLLPSQIVLDHLGDAMAAAGQSEAAAGAYTRALQFDSSDTIELKLRQLNGR